jgi:hypothetical protein
VRGRVGDDEEPVPRLGDDIGRGDRPARYSQGEARHRHGCRFGAGRGRVIEQGASLGHHRVLAKCRSCGEILLVRAEAGMTHIFRRAPHHRRRGLLVGGASVASVVERSAKAADDQPAHRRRVAEADFGLGRVDVDVDVLERDLEE